MVWGLLWNYSFGIGFAQAMVRSGLQGIGDGFGLTVLTRLRILVSAPAGDLRSGLLLFLAMLKAWRAMAGATTLIRALGGSLLRG